MTSRPQLYVHVGTPKTGTTYLQDVCWHNRSLLAEDGVTYPGAAPDSQFRGVSEVMSARFPAWGEQVVPGSWDALLAEARQATGTALLSHELLAPASPEEARRVLDDLAFADVHLVCTARNLASQIPSVWQEDVKNGHRFGLAEFVAGLREDERPRSVWLADAFWDFQDLPKVLRVWGAHLPPERVHVVTVPPRGSAGVLWDRFAGLLGLRDSGYDIDVSKGNRSLGMAEAELVRRVNVALDGRLDPRRHQQVVKFWIATDRLAQRAGKAPIVLGAGDYEWAAKRAQEHVAAIEDAGYHVVGDLHELLPGPPPADAPETVSDAVDPERVLDASLDAITELAERLVTELDREPPRPPDWKDRLVALSQRNDAVMRLRKGYQRLAGRE